MRPQSAGMIERTTAGHMCFVPNPLPPRLSLSRETIERLQQAMFALGQVEMCEPLLQSPNLLVYGSLRREAIASSTIEGTIASPDELIMYEIGRPAERGQVREVSNYRDALQFGLERLGSQPITTNLLLELHAALMLGVRGASSAGRLKEHQNFIGSRPVDRIEDAIFVPPPPERTRDLLADLERYINLPQDEPKLVQAALAHYQFETIHPFADGNGRVGRLLIILHLINLRIIERPLVYPSVYFERTRQEYYGRLQDVRNHGDWGGWIDYFLDAIISQASETVRVAKLLVRLREALRASGGDVRRQASMQRVLDAFFREPVLSVARAAQLTGLSLNTAQAALESWTALGTARELTRRRKSRMFACVRVLDLLLRGPDLAGRREGPEDP